MGVKIQHVHKAVRLLNSNDAAEGNSRHLDAASKALVKKTPAAVRMAIKHIEKHDDTKGNSPLVDKAASALQASIAKD